MAAAVVVDGGERAAAGGAAARPGGVRGRGTELIQGAGRVPGSQAGDRGDAAGAPAGDSAESPLPEAKNADALVAVARFALSAPDWATPPPAEIVVVDRAVLADDTDEGRCYLDGGWLSRRTPPGDSPAMPRWSPCSRRPTGRRDVGRKRRIPPRRLRRALRCRDRGCRFPGCGHRRFLHAHHIVHWSAGGKTSFTNLILLCGRHHRLVHEGGDRVETPSDHVFVFFETPGWGRARGRCGLGGVTSCS